jgi:hypothetical protein
MVPQISPLILLVDLIDAIPSPKLAQQRGRPVTYPDQLFFLHHVEYVKHSNCLYGVHGRSRPERNWAPPANGAVG